MHISAARVTAVALLLVAIALAAPTKGKTVKVFIFAGQSNMEGQAEVATINQSSPTHDYLNGTLAYQLKDPRTAALFAQCWDKAKNNWTVLDDVFVWYNENGHNNQGVNGSIIPSPPGNATFGKLTVGFGCEGNPNLIGPEYGFGFGVNKDGEKQLIIKTAWGGKTLDIDFRPPSSTKGPDPFCYPPSCPLTQVGHYYQVMIEDVHKMLAPGIIGEQFPELKGYTAELAGFGWFQGWNDGCDINATAAYETNMVNFIQDVRNEFSVPDLPFVIAASGFGGFQPQNRTPASSTPWIDMDPYNKTHTDCTNDRGCRRLDIVLSQFAATNLTRHPDLKSNVATVETRGFWRDAQYSPNQGQGYHFWHNAETYFLVGQGMATAMNKMTTAAATTTTVEEE